MTPVGIYDMRYTSRDGFCPAAVVSNVESITGHFIELTEPVLCDAYTEEYSEWMEGGCFLTQEYLYEYNDTGIVRGALSIEVTECGASNCMHLFDIHFTRR